MVYILYLVLGFYIYFILYWLIAWHPPYFIRSSPFYLASPFCSVSKDQNYFYLSSIRSCCCSCCFKSSLVVVRRLFVPAKCVRIIKICKTHYKCYYTTMIYLNTHAPVFMPPYYLSSYPSKKNNYFLSTSHLVYPFQKSVVLVLVDVYLLLDKVRKKRKKIQRLWSYMYFDERTYD